MTQLEIQEALWWLDEVAITISLTAWAYGYSLKVQGKSYEHQYMFAGLIGVWAIYSLLWSV